MSEPYRIKKIPTADEFREMLIEVEQGMIEKYGPNFERMPERPGLTPEALKFRFDY
jgi:hypothetical protein